MLTDLHKTILIVAIVLAALLLFGFALFAMITSLSTIPYWKQYGWLYLAWFIILTYHVLNHSKVSFKPKE